MGALRTKMIEEMRLRNSSPRTEQSYVSAMTITLEAQEFIRRFLLHVLPDGFMRIRHFGFLANRAKKHALAQCRKLLDCDPPLPACSKLSAKDLLLKLTSVDLSRCPSCHEGTMIAVGELAATVRLPRGDSS